MRARSLFSTSLLLLSACATPAPSALPPASPPPAAAPVTPATTAVEKSPLDQRDFRAVTLDNGLRAIIVSDPDADMAAASLDVHIGSFADPAERQGLAHFLEHMLFMGTEAFPDVDAYRRYISSHGGRSNAYTSGEHTAYFFEVQHDALAGALDRFAPFFVSPLLDPEYVERERKAVDSEYRLKIKDSYRRARAVLDATTNPAHPESKFSVGNVDTLADRPNDPVYEDLRSFYEAHYGPERMVLAVVGREDLDTLEGWVRERFAAVSGEPQPKAARAEPFLQGQTQIRIDIQAIRDKREVELQWKLPPREAIWPKRPHNYLTNLLGHEGEGTLFAVLKERGLIEALVTGYADASDDHDLFSISMDLTTEGHERVDEVIATTFEYLRLLREQDPARYMHDEMATMDGLAFRFLEEMPSLSLAQRLTDAMHYYPLENTLNWWATWGEFDAPAITGLLDRMTVDNVRVVVTSPDAETDTVEPLYDVGYKVRPLTAEEQTRYGATSVDPALRIPAPNPWLPQDVALKSGSNGAEPALIVDEPALKVWHMQQTRFGAPRGYVKLRLFTSAKNELKTNILGELHVRLLKDELELWKYPANLAGLSFAWDANTGELELTLSGYHDKQEKILEELLTRLFALQIDETRFRLEKEELARDWRNRLQQRPYQQASDALKVALNPEAWSRPDAVPTLERLTPADLRAFRTQAFENVVAQLFVHGNHDQGAARSMAELVRTRVLDGRAGTEMGVNRTRLLPAGTSRLRIDVDHEDSSLIVTYQGKSPDLKTEAQYELLGAVLSTPFFTQLRTEQQLGYIVSANACSHDVLPALCLVIQSASTPADELLARVDEFLLAQRLAITSMSPEELATIQRGVVARLREADTQLFDESRELHYNLAMRQPWDHDEQLAKAVEALDKVTLLAFYERAVLSDEAARLVVESYGRAHTKPPPGAGLCTTLECIVRALPEEHSRDR